MLFTWDTSNLCIVFRQWHITGTVSLVFSLAAIVALCAGYEALREASRKYELWLAGQQDGGYSEFPPPSPFLHVALPGAHGSESDGGRPRGSFGSGRKGHKETHR